MSTGNEPDAEEIVDRGRRGVLAKLGLVSVVLGVGLPSVFSARSLVPNVLYEKPRRVKIGSPDRFGDGSTFLPEHRLFIFRKQQTFHAISARCTHLGCTVQLARLDGAGKEFEFRCPCHGSKFHGDGTNYAGPAPRPLEHCLLEIAPEDGQLVVDMSQTTARDWRLTV